jgi:hypothetical protein
MQALLVEAQRDTMGVSIHAGRLELVTVLEAQKRGGTIRDDSSAHTLGTPCNDLFRGLG